MKPFIITTGAHIFTEQGYMQNLLWQVYADGILIGGGLPLFATDAIPDDAAQLAEQADGLFVSGGFDVSPACYGEEKLDACGNVDNKRDELELELIDAFVKKETYPRNLPRLPDDQRVFWRNPLAGHSFADMLFSSI